MFANEMGGMSIEGKWLNKMTGEIIYVTNYVDDGDTSIIISDHGQISMNDFMNNYIQASDDNLYDNNGNIIGKSENEINNTKTNNNIKTDDDFYIDDIPVELFNNTTTNTKKNNEDKLELKNEKIIKKLFDKIESKPQIHLTIDWADFPKNEISTLVNFLDVDIDDISKYIEREFITTDEISGEITKIIQSKLND